MMSMHLPNAECHDSPFFDEVGNGPFLFIGDRGAKPDLSDLILPSSAAKRRRCLFHLQGVSPSFTGTSQKVDGMYHYSYVLPSGEICGRGFETQKQLFSHQFSAKDHASFTRLKALVKAPPCPGCHEWFASIGIAARHFQ